MARTLTEIENVIITAESAETELAGLTSTSKTAMFLMWRKVVATAQRILEQLWDAKKEELELLAESAVPGTELWYAARGLEFQYGYALSESNGKLYYLIEDETAKIVDKISVVGINGTVYIKVAKDNSGTLQKLTNAERIAFQSYINDIKFAGTRTNIISADPDLVKVASLTVYYDGKLNLTAFKASVEAAINTYLNKAITPEALPDAFKNKFFGGQLSVNKFRDAIEAVSGTIDTGDFVLQCKPDGGSYSTVSRLYSSASGYFKIDPTFPLSTQITYVAQ